MKPAALPQFYRLRVPGRPPVFLGAGRLEPDGTTHVWVHSLQGGRAVRAPRDAIEPVSFVEVQLARAALGRPTRN